MITSNKNHPFGSKVATVETPSFCCWITTAKEGIFQKQSVKFSDFTNGLQNRRHVAKLLFNDAVDSKTRLELHDTITQLLDEFGMDGIPLKDALLMLFDTSRTQGIGSGVLFGA